MSAEGYDTRMVPAQFGPSLNDLKTYVQTNKIEFTTRVLEDFYAEMRKGASSLIMNANGDIIHVTDVVVFQLSDKSGRILVFS